MSYTPGGSVNALGQMATIADPITVMKDTFDGNTIDTTNSWTTAGTVLPTQSSGTMNINPGATASATSAVNSQASFAGGVNIGYAFQMKIEATTIATGNYRFWGIGTSPSGTGTSAAPLQEATGFEVTTTGQLRAVVYAAGAVVYSQNLTTPVDGGTHLYFVEINSGTSFFYYDTTAVASASTSLTPAVQTLPIRVVSLNSASVTGTPTLAMTGFGVVDYSRTTNQIADGDFPWRKAEVTALKQISTVAKDLTATASISANAITGATILLNGASSYTVDLSGTFVGTIQIQVSVDGVTNFRNFTSSNSIQNVATGVYQGGGSITSAGSFVVDVAGLGAARVITTAYTSGTIVVAARASTAPAMIGIEGVPAVSQSGTWTVQPGNTANTTAWLANPLIPAVSTTGDTGAKTVTGNGATQTNTTAKGATIVINMGAVTGTSPTFVAKIQGSADGGTTWVDLPGATTASLTATGVFGIQVCPGIAVTAGTTVSGTLATANVALPRNWRVVWTIGGTTPSFTITNVQVTYLI